MIIGKKLISYLLAIMNDQWLTTYSTDTCMNNACFQELLPLVLHLRTASCTTEAIITPEYRGKECLYTCYVKMEQLNLVRY